MGDSNKLDFVLTADGELVPAGESPKAPPPAAPNPLPKAAPPAEPPKKRAPPLPSFPALARKGEPASEAAPPKVEPQVPAPKAAPPARPSQPVVPPPPPPPPVVAQPVAPPPPPLVAQPVAPPPPPVAAQPVAPPPMPGQPLASPPAAARPVPPPTPELETPPTWGGDRTEPDSGAGAAAASLADDLMVPPPGPAPRASSDEALTSREEEEQVLRDRKYRDVLESLASIEGDEALDGEPLDLDDIVSERPSEEPRVIRGTAVAPPKPQLPPGGVSSTRPSVTGSTPGQPNQPEPRRVPRIVPGRTIKERNRNS